MCICQETELKLQVVSLIDELPAYIEHLQTKVVAPIIINPLEHRSNHGYYYYWYELTDILPSDCPKAIIEPGLLKLQDIRVGSHCLLSVHDKSCISWTTLFSYLHSSYHVLCAYKHPS